MTNLIPGQGRYVKSDFPKRSRRQVCRHLRFDGSPVVPEQLKRLIGGDTSSIARWNSAVVDKRARCSNRPMVDQPAPGYMMDVCSSDWSNDCPFHEYGEFSIPTRSLL